MKNKLLYIAPFLCLLLPSILSGQSEEVSQNIKLTSEDLHIIKGDWEGSLTYIDYRTNKPYTMPANLVVQQSNNKNQFTLSNIYPNEPKANSSDKIKISKDGLMINKKTIHSKEILSDGSLKITTEHAGKDNNKKALIRNIYILGKDQFIIRKEVKFLSSDNWMKRNEYRYKRPD